MVYSIELIKGLEGVAINQLVWSQLVILKYDTPENAQ